MAMFTSAFSNLVSAAVGEYYYSAYNENMPWAEVFKWRKGLTQSEQISGMGHIARLSQIAENDDIPELDIYENASSTLTHYVYAGRLIISRLKMICAKNLRNFDDIGQSIKMLAQSYNRQLEYLAMRQFANSTTDTIFNTLTLLSNAHTVNGSSTTFDNLGAALSYSTLTSGIAAMGCTLLDHGEVMSVRPTHLLVAEALRQPALQILDPNNNRTNSLADINDDPYVTGLKLISNPILDQLGYTGAWFLIDANNSPITYSMLDTSHLNVLVDQDNESIKVSDGFTAGLKDTSYIGIYGYVG